MSSKSSLDAAGTPVPRHIYAVFDSERDAQAAATDLSAIQVETEILGPNEAQLLKEPSTGGITGKLGRMLKGIGGESNMAERYAEHLRAGKYLLAAPADTQELAEHVSRVMAQHGAYDITYFRDWSIQYMSPSENSARGLPTHSHTNTGE